MSETTDRIRAGRVRDHAKARFTRAVVEGWRPPEAGGSEMERSLQEWEERLGRPLCCTLDITILDDGAARVAAPEPIYYTPVCEGCGWRGERHLRKLDAWIEASRHTTGAAAA